MPRTHTMPDGFVLTVEQNPKAIVTQAPVQHGRHQILLPPMNLGPDYWLLRVKVSGVAVGPDGEAQAVQLFPKFSVLYGVGFRFEKADWNTNLPSAAGADTIFRHIAKNKGDDSIPDDRCMQAIQLLREEIVALTGDPKQGADPEFEAQCRDVDVKLQEMESVVKAEVRRRTR